MELFVVRKKHELCVCLIVWLLVYSVRVLRYRLPSAGRPACARTMPLVLCRIPRSICAIHSSRIFILFIYENTIHKYEYKYKCIYIRNTLWNLRNWVCAQSIIELLFGNKSTALRLRNKYGLLNGERAADHIRKVHAGRWHAMWPTRVGQKAGILNIHSIEIPNWTRICKTTGTNQVINPD